MNKIRKYFVFEPLWWWFLRIAIITVMSVGMQCFTAFDPLIIFLVMVTSVGMLEIVVDFWFFGAIGKKGFVQFEYLKTSKRGIQILKGALYIGAVWNLIELLLVFVINIVVPMVMQGNLQANMRSGMALLGLIFCVWFLEMLGVTIGRICDGVMINTGVAMGGMVLAIFFLIAALNYPAIILVVAVALAVPMMIFGINFVLKRVRESYYDERVKVRV